MASLPDDQVDDAVWSDGPLINNFGYRVAVLGLSSVEALPFLINTATAKGCIVFDWQDGKIHRTHLAQSLDSTVSAPLKKADVRRLVFEQLGSVVSAAGFHLKKSEMQFTRRIPGGAQTIGLPVLDYHPVYVFSLYMLIRLDAVDEIYHRFSDIDPKYHAQGWTTNTPLSYFVKSVPKRYRWGRQDQYRVETTEDIEGALAHLLPVVQRDVLPFFERYQTLDALHIAMNRTRHGVFAALHAGMNGSRKGPFSELGPGVPMQAVILAYLAKSSDLQKIISRRRKFDPLDRDLKERFEQLVSWLNQHPLPGEQSIT
jgi:hypothetical protein